MRDEVSDEILHAYVDGELDLADREALMLRIQQEPELARRVCAIRGLSDMMRLAYVEPPALRTARAAGGSRALMARCATGCLVLGLGLWVGWTLRGLDGAPGLASMNTLPELRGQPVSLAQVPDLSRVMLHLDGGDPARMRAALDEAERLLDSARRGGRALQLELVANGHGLELLRAGLSPHAGRIAQMQSRHVNLHWVACGQSVARFTAEGQTVELLPAVRQAPSAIGEIITRLQQGWTYIRV